MVQRYRFPAEQIFNRNAANLSAQKLGSQQVSDTRQSLANQARRPAVRENFTHLPAGSGWNCNDDLFDFDPAFPETLHNRWKFDSGSVNAHATGEFIPLEPVIVDEPYG
jgi:hypothetical protein